MGVLWELWELGSCARQPQPATGGSIMPHQSWQHNSHQSSETCSICICMRSPVAVACCGQPVLLLPVCGQGRALAGSSR
jgi:hypothetical protein